jgi:hypothetical protein
MSGARDLIHAKFCTDPACDRGGAEKCKNLDYLLDLAEDARVHAEVHRILDISMEAMLVHGSQVNQGLGLAIRTVDPYEHRADGLRRKKDGAPITCEKCPTKK